MILKNKLIRLYDYPRYIFHYFNHLEESKLKIRREKYSKREIVENVIYYL